MITGKEIHNLARRLWRINRSITGDGNRLTLDILKEICPEMKIYEVPSGTKVFDWTVPNEWNVKEAWIKDPSGNKIVDFEECNLHLVGYSIPVHKTINLKQLQNHLHSRPDLPSAIPYVTSYYNHYWGFCLSDLQRRSLCKGEYEVYVDSELKNGSLTYGEILLEGESKQEIFLSTYICHPSMANNELSGMTVTAYIAKWLASLKQRQYSYRIIFIPETIGSLTYLNKNLKKMKDNIIAGFNVSCVGDDRMYSYLPSRSGNSLADQVAKHTLKFTSPDYRTFLWNDRGSDERQYCAPGIDLPVVNMARTKSKEYPEYHTSLDDLDNVVTPTGLHGGFKMIYKAIKSIESNCYPQASVLGEPNLGSRGLYPTLGATKKIDSVHTLKNILTYSDGKTSLLEIAEKCDVFILDLLPTIKILKERNLLTIHNSPVFNFPNSINMPEAP